jgi:hypothetical protein
VLYPIIAYLLVGLGILLMFLAYHYQRYILLLFSSGLFFFVGFSFLTTNLLSKVGDYSSTNSSVVNLTLTNLTHIYQNNSGINQYPFGILFILLAFFLVFDGVYSLTKIGDA